MSQEQTEQVRLLNSLVRADNNHSQVKQELVMQRQPEWGLLERAGLIKKGMAEALAGLHALDAEQRADAIEEGLWCSRSRTSRFTDEEIQYFIQGLVGGRFPVSEAGRLDALVNILKIDTWRPFVWDTRNVPDLLLKNLSLMQPPSVVYKAVFCVWLLSFHEGFPNQLTETGILKATCEVLKESRVEKIVRVGLHVIDNFLSCEDAVEIIIEENLAQILTLLEFEKWRDADMVY
ncbi:vacuolar ATP synthase subunit h, putative [Eimeria maxima]|uniref:Vacuolar ATP synthase subunit h, putative n=1 Tax=Eimeria maxima TaxID=5804 RepID=U6M3K9_EIMMA|nr:vacuolar ATP synthase subunit h, putative [Eimeria maxima]CDJ57653.1 vacuolar ATP synthase subunit h, putative [Eimeria maxima]